MRNVPTRLILSAAIGAALLLTSLPRGASPQESLKQTSGCDVQGKQVEQAYAVTDLGTLGGSQSLAFGINNRVQLAGLSLLSGDSGLRAYLWENGRMNDLGTLGGPNSYGFYVNSLGKVVGWADVDQNARHAFLWQSGRMTDLGTLGDPNSSALGLSVTSDAVGYSDVPSIDPDTGMPAFHAFRWTRGSITDLGTLGGLYSSGESTNSRGQVVGCGGGRQRPSAGLPPGSRDALGQEWYSD
jgi:probable HAF family extracellular repeat protein